MNKIINIFRLTPQLAIIILSATGAISAFSALHYIAQDDERAFSRFMLHIICLGLVAVLQVLADIKKNQEKEQ